MFFDWILSSLINNNVLFGLVWFYGRLDHDWPFEKGLGRVCFITIFRIEGTFEMLVR